MPGLPRLPRNTVRLHAQELEARATPAMYTVTGTADGLGAVTPTGTGTFDASTLRAAVIAANSTPEADTVVLPAGTYRLTLTGTFEDAAAAGDLDVVGAGGPLSVTGAGPEDTVVDGNRNDRSFDVLAGGNLTLTGMTVANGYNAGGEFTEGGGGARVVGGTLVLRNVTVADNIGEDFGGGLFVGGNATVSASDTVIARNKPLDSSTAFSFGGGIAVANDDNIVTLTRTRVVDNYATYGGGGIYYNTGARSTVRLIDSVVSGNQAAGTGGGIRFVSNYSGTLELTRSRVSGNTSSFTGGGLKVGGNVTVTATDSVISDNRANGALYFPTAGAGLYATVGADVTLTRTTISGNVAVGIKLAYFSDAPASIGGGLAAVRGASITLEECTVSGNAVVGAETALGPGPARGGGVLVDAASSLTVRNTTVATNRTESGGPAEGGGLFVEAGGTVTVESTVVAGNVAATGGVDVSGAVASLGSNLVGDGTGATGFAASDLVGTTVAPIDARLGPLADNGGLTPTHALLPGSPALDRGSNSAGDATDQRGLPRTRGASTDVGPFERQPPAITSPSSAVFAVRSRGAFTVTTTGDGPITLSPVGSLPPGVTFTDNGDGTATLAGTSRLGGTFALTITASNGTSENPTQRFVLTVEPVPVPLTAIATGPGVPVTVNVYAADGSLRYGLTPYPGFTGGATVATGDLTGDGVDDIVTGAGPGGGPHVRVFDGATGGEFRSFFAYDPATRLGVNVAVADLDGDGTAEVLTGAGAGGGPHVKVFRFVDLVELRSFFAFDPESRSGVTVAGLDGVIVAGVTPGQPGAVRLFRFADSREVATFFPFGEAFTGGLSVTADAGLIAVGAGSGGGPAVTVLTANGVEVASFFAFDESFRGGVTVGSTGGLDPRLVVGAGPGGGPAVQVYSPDRTLVRSFFAFDPAFVGGVFVG